MTAKKHNRVQIVYQYCKPYMYGAVLIVDGDVENRWSERPFVISRKMANGDEIFYGTVKRVLDKIQSQIDRLSRFGSETQAKLQASGITPLGDDGSLLPESEVSTRIMDEQEELIENVLLEVSVNIRILSEIFPDRLQQSTVKVYDYDDACVGDIRLSEIANLLVHNRYIVVKDHHVVDLISDKKFLIGRPQMGLKIDFIQYIEEVGKVINGIAVKDLASKLRCLIKNLSASSNIKDIIFVAQNLYALGEPILWNEDRVDGPIKTILDRVMDRNLKRKYANRPMPSGVVIPVRLVHTTPNFYLEPDLNHKQIKISMRVNDEPESDVKDYEEFFQEFLSAYGHVPLRINSPRPFAPRRQ